MTWSPDCIFIGASAGGVTAIQSILSALPKNFRIPIVIVQHVPATARIDLNQVYFAGNGAEILEAEDKMSILPQSIYMAAPDYHLLIEPGDLLCLSQDDPVHFSRPSIDVCLISAAHVYTDRALGIVLTGANDDGAQGLLTMQECGAKTIVQDPNDAEFNEMPRAALARMQPDYVLRLSEIQKYLAGLKQPLEPDLRRGVALEN